MLSLIRKLGMIADCFTLTRSEWTLTELSDHLNIPKPTIYHILNSLKGIGWVAQDPATKRYRLGIRIWELGWVAIHPLGLREIARPHLDRLAESSGESVHLSVIDAAHPEFVTHIDKIDSNHPIRPHFMIGGRAPSHCVASGKVILAFNDTLFQPLLSNKLEAYTLKSVTNPKKLGQEIAAIRDTGYAISREEFQAKVIGVAAPIRNYEGRVVGACGISGPSDRLREKEIRRSIPFVVQAADLISEDMGYSQTGNASLPNSSMSKRARTRLKRVQSP